MPIYDLIVNEVEMVGDTCQSLKTKALATLAERLSIPS